MKNLRIGLIFLFTTFLFTTQLGCSTTAMYTSPSVINQQKAVYHFTIETGGFAGKNEADERAAKEIQKFMNKNGYRQYRILYSEKGNLFSGYRYTVQFTR